MNRNQQLQQPALSDKASELASLVIEQADRCGFEVERDAIRAAVDQFCKLQGIAATEAERISACEEAERLWLDKQTQTALNDPSVVPSSGSDGRLLVRKSITLEPSGRYIIDQHHRKIAEMYQPGDSPAETEAIKRRIVRSFNALPDLVGVLMRADKEGALWQALYNEGITDAYDAALKDAVEALGQTGVADVALLYELDPNSIRAKLGE
ncbi:hypothetical protein AWV80_19410 [Cupriavidus sp. UYMU48A]|nr:hypothetical protein AWV80_19410 [Cupriavidus sp. UYMU48A]